MRARKSLTFCLLLAMLMVSTVSAEKVELVVWDWSSSRMNLLKTFAAAYTKANPDVTFSFQSVALGSYPDKLTAALVAGIPPDLLFFHNKFTSAFGKHLEPFPEELFPLAKMRAEYLVFDQAFLINPNDTNFYFLPGGITTGVVFYNKDHWEQSGLSGVPKTWDELRNAGKKLTRRAGDGKLEVAGLGLRGSVWTAWADMIYQQGGWLFNEDATKANINTAEGRRALYYMQDVIFTDRSSEESGMDISKGNVALQYKWAWYRDSLDKLKDLRYGVFPIPTFTGSMLPAVARNNYEPTFAVPKGLDKAHRDAAFQFLKWLYDQDGYQIQENIMSGRIPGKTRLWRDDKVRLDPTESVLAAMAPYTIFPGEMPESQWQGPMGTLTNNFLKQTNSIEALLEEAERSANARLAEMPGAWVVERRYVKPSK